jgi:hypothetical protein
MILFYPKPREKAIVDRNDSQIKSGRFSNLKISILQFFRRIAILMIWETKLAAHPGATPGEHAWKE